MTGIASGRVLEMNMKQAAFEVKKENARVAKIIEITPVDDSDSDAQSVLDTLVAKMGLYKLADEHEEKAVESVFKDGTELIDAVTRRG